MQVQTFHYLEMMVTMGTVDLRDQKVRQEVQGLKEYQAALEIQDLKVPTMAFSSKSADVAPSSLRVCV